MFYGYTRVSNESQIQGQSLDVQKQLIENQLVLNDIPKENYTLLRDGGKSGRRTDNREEYQYLVEEIKKGYVEGVFIYSLSRLNRNVRETLDFIDLCDKKGVRVVSVYERYDSNVPASKMILYVFSGLAEQQSDEQSVRIKNSIQKKKRDRKKYTKNTPIGYELVGDELVENEEEIKLISRIRNLNSRGHSYQQIADRLNREGITTKQGKTWNRNIVFHYAKKNTKETVNG